MAMRVFIGWSGRQSGDMARALAEWLPKVLQSVEPWVSSTHVRAGARWHDEVARALDMTNYGILCVTRENCASPWVLFEAGALSNSVSRRNVVPYLLDVEPQHLAPPLSQFQAISADRMGTSSLVESINAANTMSPLSEASLGDVFGVWWPRLATALTGLSAAPSTDVVHPATAGARQPDVAGPQPLAVTSKSLGGIVRTRRIELGLTQEKLAYLIGSSYKQLGDVERGRVNVTMNYLHRLATALELDVHISAKPAN